MSKQVLVKNNELRIKGVDGVKGPIVLKPGLNQIDAEDAALISKHPIIKAEIEAGTLEFPEGLDEEKKDEAGAPAEDPIKPLLKLNVNNAKETIAQTIDVEILNSWFEKETRVTVKDLISKQLEELAKPAEHRSDK